MSEATQMTTMKNENVVVYDVTYVERVECHLEVEFHYFQRRVDVLRRNGQEQHVWNAEQRNEHQRRLRQPSAVPAFYTLNYIAIMAGQYFILSQLRIFVYSLALTVRLRQCSLPAAWDSVGLKLKHPMLHPSNLIS